MGVVELKHGGGGRATSQLIDIFAKYFDNDILSGMEDSALLHMEGDMAFTTDSFVIEPYYFPGGDIGRLSVCGTVNDLVCRGARPLYLSSALVIEEGFDIADLERIAQSMAKAAGQAGAHIVTGDTKVVGKGHADGVYINTAGIGRIVIPGISAHNAVPGDKVMVTGSIGDHSIATLSAREGMDFTADVESDCAPLSCFIDDLMPFTCKVHTIRDATRGGLAAVLNEIARASGVSIKIYEDKIPVKQEVKSICDVLGFDILTLANEGKLVIFAPADSADDILSAIREEPLGCDAAIIGEVAEGQAIVTMETTYATDRIIDLPYGELLPRIC
jgi:hydrogenase expression/formation protein HypE